MSYIKLYLCHHCLRLHCAEAGECIEAYIAKQKADLPIGDAKGNIELPSDSPWVTSDESDPNRTNL